MSTQPFGIDNFLLIETLFENKRESIETSYYCGVQDYFETHLSSTFHDPEQLAQYGVQDYSLKVGDEITINPSKWTVDFVQEKGLDMGNDYEFSYRVVNMSIRYLSRDLRTDEGLPTLTIKITLQRN